MLNLDEAAIPEWSMAVVGFVNADGQQAFKYYITKGAPGSSVTHALEAIKHDVLHLIGE